MTTEIFAAKSAVAAAFLHRQNVAQIRSDWKSNLSGVEQRARFVDKVLPGAQFLEFLLTPTDKDHFDEASKVWDKIYIKSKAIAYFHFPS